MSGPRVLMLAPEAHGAGGGLGVACAGLARALLRGRVEVTLLTMTADGGARLAGAPYVRVPTRGIPELLREGDDFGPSYDAYAPGIDPRPLARFAEAVAALVEEHDFDVVHAHDWPTFQAGELAKRLVGLPLVCHVHSSEFERRGAAALAHVYARERRGLERADGVIAVGYRSAERLARDYGVRASRLAVVHGALDDEFAPDVRSEPPDETIAFVGRLAPQKAPELFVQVAERLSRRRPRARFLVAGDGELFPELVENVAERGLARTVRFLGNVPRERLGALFRTTTLLLHCARAEPFGLAVLEAAAHGVPALVRRGAGVSDVLPSLPQLDDDGPDEWVERAADLLASGDERRRIAKATRHEAVAQRWSARAGQVATLYDALLAGTRAAGRRLLAPRRGG